MGHVSVFWATLAGCTGFAMLQGGMPERGIATIFLLGAAASAAALRPLGERYQGVEVGVFLVDVTMFVGLAGIALRSRRYWPQWIVAMQMLEVASHFSRLLPDVIRLAYGVILSFWAYPMLLVLVAGTARHRIRVARGQDEGSWAPRG